MVSYLFVFIYRRDHVVARLQDDVLQVAQAPHAEATVGCLSSVNSENHVCDSRECFHRVGDSDAYLPAARVDQPPPSRRKKFFFFFFFPKSGRPRLEFATASESCWKVNPSCQPSNDVNSCERAKWLTGIPVNDRLFVSSFPIRATARLVDNARRVRDAHDGDDMHHRAHDANTGALGPSAAALPGRRGGPRGDRWWAQ